MSGEELRAYNRAKMRRWRAANRTHWLESARAYKAAARVANPEKARAQDRARYERDGERILERNAKYRAQKQAAIATLKDVPCADCGQRFHWVAMQFDHVRGEKRFDISLGGTRYSMPVVLAEIAKCEVVCANCHALRTYRRVTGNG